MKPTANPPLDMKTVFVRYFAAEEEDEAEEEMEADPTDPSFVLEEI